MQSQRWAWTHQYAVPMFLASLAAVLLAGLALVAFLIFDVGDETNPPSDGNALGDCVVGSWNLAGYREQTSYGNAEMVEGTPAFRFDEDGTGEADYGDPTTIQTEAFGVEAPVNVAGRITFQYEISDGTIEFVGQDSSATMSTDLELPGLDDTYDLESGALDARCDGDTMTIASDTVTYELQRS